jgi:hypothetical protein
VVGITGILGGILMDKFNKYLYPLGMVGVVLYFFHIILGNILWEEYNPITTDISSLTADGAPNAQLLKVIAFIYSICMIVMVIALVVKAFNNYHGMLKTGFVILLVMQLTSAIGYSLFPLAGNKTEMNFQNMMHIMVTVIVVFTTIASSFLIALGYMKQENTKKLGKIALVFTILITLFGMFNPVSMAMQLNILGLSERLVIYTIQIFMFILSYYYTFLEEGPESANV